MTKYARIEIERRFLVPAFPLDMTVTRVRHLTDRYIEGTRLRLREQRDEDGSVIFKLTQKIPPESITTIYLDEAEFQIFAQLPALTLRKTRHSVPPFGIDVFADNLQGLIMAEAEFDSRAAAAALTIPPYLGREVTTDARFTGGQLVRLSPQALQMLLSPDDTNYQRTPRSGVRP